MHEADPLFQYEIIKVEKIYEKDEFLTDEIEERIMKLAEDLQFKEKNFDKEVMEAIEDGYIEFEYRPNS
jgi:parvulin-like peptidyl-prolyl isomerase